MLSVIVPGTPAWKTRMARFSDGAEHTRRRAAVEEAVARIDPLVVERQAFERAQELRLVGATIDDIATTVPDGVLSAHVGDDVAALSILFQTRDATAALIRNALEDGGVESSLRRRPPVVTTRRVDTETGEVLVVDLTDRPFGDGPHRCPGERLAIALATGVVNALA